MSTNTVQRHSITSSLQQLRLQRGLAFGVIIVIALVAFEIFNYSTTEFALSDLLGDLRFAGIRWATILAIAFCGIDFAGIARLFTPELASGEEQGPNETWYLFGAWLLAATMNAMLTWWGVSLAILNHNTLGNEVVARDMLLRIVPIFVAVMVWLIRVLMIGSFSMAGPRLFSQAEQTQTQSQPQTKPQQQNQSQNRTNQQPLSRPATARSFTSQQGTGRTSTNSMRRNASSSGGSSQYTSSRPEPTYHDDPGSISIDGTQTRKMNAQSETARVNSGTKRGF
jgi:hypothetical protein